LDPNDIILQFGVGLTACGQASFWTVTHINGGGYLVGEFRRSQKQNRECKSKRIGYESSSTSERCFLEAFTANSTIEVANTHSYAQK
jgi:hypothetical protein